MAAALSGELAFHSTLFTCCRLTCSVLQVEINLWWCAESKRFGDLCEVELVDIEALLVAMRSIGVQVSPISIPGAPVQVVIFFDNAFQLRLDVRQFVWREAIFRNGHAVAPQLLQET